jgi:hypothetical protein
MQLIIKIGKSKEVSVTELKFQIFQLQVRAAHHRLLSVHYKNVGH